MEAKTRTIGKRSRLLLVSTWLVLLWSWAPAATPESLRQNFVEVAYIPEGPYADWSLEASDTDHDGLQEVLFSSLATVCIYEHVGNNQYERVLAIGTGGAFWAVGDADDDGLSDVVVQDNDSLQVFESPAPDSYPTRCVWQWEELCSTNPRRTKVTDLDQDGSKELLMVRFAQFVCILENTGDNSYTEVFRDTLPYPPYGAISEATPGDFDLDGKMEYVTSDDMANVWIFENVAVGVDSFILTWQGDALAITAYENASANDMDEDGKPEFVIGAGHPMPYQRFVFTVFETTGDDNYELVWCDSSLTSGVLDQCDVACGDVDGDSIDEMLFSVDENGIFLYKCTGPDSYERIWEWHTMYGIGGILIYDLNQNGYGEIVVSTPGGTWIFEKELPGVNEMPDARRQMPEVKLMQNVPNPFAQTTNVRYQIPRPGHTSLRIYDHAGRLVRSLVDGEKEAGCHSVRWDSRRNDGTEAPSGVYFYRLIAGNFTAARKMVVLR